MGLRTAAICLSLTVCTCAVPARALAQAESTADLNARTTTDAPRTAADAGTAAVTAPRRTEISVGQIVDGLVRDFKRLPSSDTARLLAAGSMVAFMGQSADKPVSTWMSGQRTLSTPLEPGNIIGGFQMQLGGALATYAVGRLADKPRVAAVGADLLRAHIVSQTVTGVIKMSASRTRPDGTRLSFPSGHTSATFASATVLQQHFGWKAGVPAMAVAGYVAAARVQKKRHFLSDVAFGAAIGIAAGRTVTFGEGRGRFAVAPAVAPGGAGVAVTWVGR